MSGDEILERAPWVDFVVGTGNVERVGQIVRRVREERRQVTALELPQESPVYQFRQISRGSLFQAYVTVIEGCDQFCTFCIVPFTRGRERCRRSGEILEEVAWLVQSGYTEITLLGQTVNAYRDPGDGSALGELLTRAAGVPGVRRLRFLTSHPRFVDDPLIARSPPGGRSRRTFTFRRSRGRTGFSTRMKRRYDSRYYLDTLERIRQAVPDAAISSDFIVGFPGETEEDFAGTLELVRRARFANVFAFLYSPQAGDRVRAVGERDRRPAGDRVGAPAAAPGPPGGAAVADEPRSRRQPLRGPVEGHDRQGQARGRTPCNRIVHVPDETRDLSPGRYVSVRITRGLPNSLIGELAR